MIEWVAFLPRIWEVRDSYLGSETAYSEIFRGIP
jgi:hypothetical protein